MKNNHITIDLGHNVTWEVERVDQWEKASYWWSKSQLKQIRDDYKNEVMLEGVRKLVWARVEKEEEDPRKIEKRVEEIMQMEPGAIATFLTTKPALAPIDAKMNSSPVSDSDSDSDSSTDSDSDSSASSMSSSEIRQKRENNRRRFKPDDEDDLIKEHRICELLGHCSCSVKRPVGVKVSSPTNNKVCMVAGNGINMRSNDDDDDSISTQSSSDDDNDSHSSSSSSSSSSSASSEDGSMPSLTHGEESKSIEINTKGQKSDLPPTTVMIPTSPEMSMKATNSQEKTGSGLTLADRKALRSRFRQGVLAVVAVERLQNMVIQEEQPHSSVMEEMLSSSSRLIDLYLPSDDEDEDEVNSVSSDDSDSDNSFSDDLLECPVCLDLIDPKQERKIILLRRMLCKCCFETYYINRGRKFRTNDIDNKAPNPTSMATKQNNDEMNFNTERDVQILNSLKRCISTTNKSPLLPVLPMRKEISANKSSSEQLKKNGKVRRNRQ